MCNALSPEKAVMWTVLYEGAWDPALRPDHFTYENYRRWFRVMASLVDDAAKPDEAAFLARAEALGVEISPQERRALKRMLRVPPPPRVRANHPLLVRALTDHHAGRRVHIERLIN